MRSQGRRNWLAPPWGLWGALLLSEKGVLIVAHEIVDGSSMQRALTRITYEIIEQNKIGRAHV